MEVVDTRDTRMNALCEVCGSDGFKEFVCQCSQCNNCSEHVYCMVKNIPYIPDTWICGRCLPLSVVHYEPMRDIISGNDEETLVVMDQSDDKSNYGEQAGRVPIKVSRGVNDTQLEELGDEVLTFASGTVHNACHSGEQGMEVTLEAAGNTYCYSHSEGHGVISAQGALYDAHSDLQCRKVPLEDSVMADVESNSDVQGMMVGLKSSGNSDNDSRLEVQSQSMGDVESDSQLEGHGKMVTPRASGFTDCGWRLVELGKKVPSDASNAADCNSHSVNAHKIVPPGASGVTNEDSCLVGQIKEVSPKASDVACNDESCFRQQDEKHVQKVVGVVISDPHSAEQGKVPPKAFKYGNTPPPRCEFIYASADLRVQLKTNEEKIGNLDMKIRHSKDKLRADLKKIEEIGSRTAPCLVVKKWLAHKAR